MKLAIEAKPQDAYCIRQAGSAVDRSARAALFGACQSNPTGGQGIFDRTVYAGLRDRSPIEFIERRRLNISTIYRLTVKGSF